MRLKILGPPGTGKTTRALSYVREFQKDPDIQKIIFSSFTVKARKEAQDRLQQMGGLDKTSCETIHALAFEHMKYKRPYMVNTLFWFAKSIGQTSAIRDDRYTQLAKTPLEKSIAYYQISRSRMKQLGELEPPDGLSMDTVMAYVNQFETWKIQDSRIDYNDVLINYLRRGDELDYDAALVDEAQDLSLLQWSVANKMFRQARHYYTVGDDDQSIFGFAGTDVEDFIGWPCDKLVVLERSYRLGVNTFNYSKTVLSHIQTRLKKDFLPCDRESRVRFSNGIDPVEDIIPYTSCAILHRNAYIAGKIKETLNAQGITYSGKGSPFWIKAPLKAIAAWEEWRAGETLLGNRIHNIIKFIPDTVDIDKKGLLDLGVKAKAPPCPFPHVPWYNILDMPNKLIYQNVQDLHGYDYLLAPPTVEITTIHQSKGGEWDKVILLTDVSAATFKQFSNGTSKDREEEHRVWYVAVTRAKQELQIIRPSTLKYYPLEEP